MLLAYAKAALARGFFIFALRPRDQRPFDSRSFKGALGPSDPVAALMPWRAQPACNIGIALEASDLIVFDFDKPEYIPEWLNAIHTYKVRTSRGIQIYFVGARDTKGIMKIMIGGVHVGEVKSIGGYVVAAGSVHPDGPTYTVIDDSPVAPMPPEAVALLSESRSAQAASNAQPINVSPESVQGLPKLRAWREGHKWPDYNPKERMSVYFQSLPLTQWWLP